MRPDVVVFDLDDTLYPELAYARSGLRAAGQHVSMKWKVPDVADEMIALLEAGRRHTIFDEVLLRHDLSLQIVPELVAVYRAHVPTVSLEDSTQRVLAALKHGGMSVAVLTDGPSQAQQNKVDALGLDALVDAVVLTDAGNGRETWKPSPWGYREVERRFGPGNYVYVADNVEKDFVTARTLGWHTIELRRRDRMYTRLAVGSEYEADRSIGDIADLLDLWVLGARNA